MTLQDDLDAERQAVLDAWLNAHDRWLDGEHDAAVSLQEEWQHHFDVLSRAALTPFDPDEETA